MTPLWSSIFSLTLKNSVATARRRATGDSPPSRPLLDMSNFAYLASWRRHGKSTQSRTKRHDPRLVRHLTIDEVRAIVGAPKTTTRLGIRDRAMLHLCFAGGLRVSELVSLLVENVCLERTPSIRVFGKGRKERCLPLWKETAADLRAWLAVRGAPPTPELFVNAQGTSMTRAGFEYVLDKHVCTAMRSCASLSGRSVSPHQLRHSCALTMLHATRDIRKVALWLGHADIRTTEIYLRVEPSEKLEAVEAVVPLGLRRGRFKAPDTLIASLFEPG
ncbi:MAG: tyrosine-type recombinase/integrase [Terriglobales bacterium]